MMNSDKECVGDFFINYEKRHDLLDMLLPEDYVIEVEKLPFFKLHVVIYKRYDEPSTVSGDTYSVD